MNVGTFVGFIRLFHFELPSSIFLYVCNIKHQFVLTLYKSMLLLIQVQKNETREIIWNKIMIALSCLIEEIKDGDINHKMNQGLLTPTDKARGAC